MDQFIVAEISKTWQVGHNDNKELVSRQFEAVINTNHARGYILKEWQFTQMVQPRVIVDTIIAIFQIA